MWGNEITASSLDRRHHIAENMLREKKLDDLTRLAHSLDSFINPFIRANPSCPDNF